MNAVQSACRPAVLASLLLSLGLPGSAPGAEAPPLAVDAASLARTTADLASREYAGRLAGSAGYEKAARMGAARLEAAGLKPALPEGWMQHFPVELVEIDRCALAVVPAGGKGEPAPLVHGPDFSCRGKTASGEAKGGVVFVGYGISRPDLGWDDYAGIDAKGKVVLAFKEPPPQAPPTGAWGDSTLPRPKANAARAQGAVALLLVPVRSGERGPRPIGSVLDGPGPVPDGVPSMEVSPAVADRLLAGTGTTIAALLDAYSKAKAPAPRETGAAVSVAVAARRTAEAPTENVVGVLEGTDAASGEWVLVGGHLDHVGTHAGLLYPGANDNASGAAAVMEIAAALGRAGKPKRTVVIALFSAEETGLLGAKHFAEHPPRPLGKLVAMLNVDCIGAGEALQLHGGESFPALFSLARRLDAAGDRVTVEKTGAGGGADAAPFFEKGVRTLYFATTKGYGDLHLPTDVPANLNAPLHARSATLALRVAAALAAGEYEREAAADPKVVPKPVK